MLLGVYIGFAMQYISDGGGIPPRPLSSTFHLHSISDGSLSGRLRMRIGRETLGRLKRFRVNEHVSHFPNLHDENWESEEIGKYYYLFFRLDNVLAHTIVLFCHFIQPASVISISKPSARSLLGFVTQSQLTASMLERRRYRKRESLHQGKRRQSKMYYYWANIYVHGWVGGAGTAAFTLANRFLCSCCESTQQAANGCHPVLRLYHTS